MKDSWAGCSRLPLTGMESSKIYTNQRKTINTITNMSHPEFFHAPSGRNVGRKSIECSRFVP